MILKKLIWSIILFYTHKRYPNMHKNAYMQLGNTIGNRFNLIMGENSTLNSDSIILNRRAKLIIGKNSGAATKLLVVTGNHMNIVGMNLKQVTDDVKDAEDKNHEYDKDVIVEDDVWIGAGVTLLSGVRIGRGCEVGTCAVVRNSTPPYSIVIGNPAKVVGFRFTPEEIIEHEKVQYPENERLPIELLEKNYNKYFLKRIKEIREWTRL